MKISIHSILGAFIIVFFVSAMFLVSSPPTMQSLPEDFRAGKVLGVSEAMADRSIIDLGKGFPKSSFRPMLPPNKKDQAENFTFQNCGGAILDSRTGTLIYTQDADQEMPIASITKLMSALVFLDTKTDWEKVYTIKYSDLVGGSKNYLVVGDEVKVKDLFYFGLVGSINPAIEALAASTDLPREEFIKRMNDKAKELGLNKTSFVDPTGLDSGDTSTAAEVVKLADAAFKNKFIQEATLTERYEFKTVGGKNIAVENTDILLDNFSDKSPRIIGGKTGFTDSAGYCFVGKFIDDNGNAVVSAVLGGPTINSRFSETKKAVAWVYDNFAWQD